MGKTARKKRSAGVVSATAGDGAKASSPGPSSAGEPAEPLERARLQAEVARQRVRIAREELKRARKRVKEAKREAKKARKLAVSARKVWKKARKAHRAKAAPEAATGTSRQRKARAQKAKGPALHRAKRGKSKGTRRRKPALPTPPGPASQGGSGPITPSSEA
jgi:hypothetical protein